jgi:hypothetical protein
MNLNQIGHQITDIVNSFDIKNPNHAKALTCLILVCVGIYSLNFIGMIFSVLVGIVYPIIKSYNAIKTKSPDDMENIITYWIFFGIFTFVESVFSVLLQTIPFYYTLKTILFGWATHYDGAKYLYETYLCPKIEEYDVDKVNEFIKILGTKLNEANAEFNKLKTN